MTKRLQILRDMSKEARELLDKALKLFPLEGAKVFLTNDATPRPAAEAALAELETLTHEDAEHWNDGVPGRQR